jgi:hypothetical protein
MRSWKKNLAIITGMGMSIVSCRTGYLELMDFSITDSEVQLGESDRNIEEDIDAVSFNNVGVATAVLEDRLPVGAIITDSGKDAFPRTLGLNFGEGIEDRRKCLKKGEIIVEMSDDMTIVGAKRTTTFKDFSIKGRKMTGTKVMTTISISDQGQPVFSVETNIEMTDKKGNVATRILTGTNTWIAGFGDDDRFNDVFSVEGTATLQRENDLMTRIIRTPLMVDRSCDFIKEGVIVLEKSGAITTIDFGDGTCDAIATVTKDGDTYEVDLEEERVNRGKGKCNKGDDADVAQNDN